ncbi:MAG: hypothetical protein Q8R40_01235 [bacterium]|nr:hypothetical protein [bacterium]
MEDVRGGLITSVQNTHSEYSKWLEGAKFFLEVQVNGDDFDLMVMGYRPIGQSMSGVFEGFCHDPHPAPMGIRDVDEDDDDAWEEIANYHASLLAKNARLTISDHEIRLDIGENYSSVIQDYEAVGAGFGEGESRGFYEDFFWNENDAGLWSVEGDAPYVDPSDEFYIEDDPPDEV